MALDEETREAIVAAVAAELDRRIEAGEHPTPDQVAVMVEAEAGAQGVTVDEAQADDMAGDASELVADEREHEGTADGDGPPPEVADVAPNEVAPAPEPVHQPPPEPEAVREVEADVADAGRDLAPGEEDPDDAPTRVHPFWGFNLMDLFRR